MLAAARCLGRRLPWVAIGHGTEFGSKRGWQAVAVRAAFRRATAVVCVSEYTRREMHRAGIRPSFDRVIPNGADPYRFRVLPAAETEPVRAELGVSEGQLLVTVGNVTRRKGQDIVVRALPKILERFPAAHYAVAGLPTLGPELERLAAELGVAARVHVLGRLSEARIVQLLNAADVFVMTSRRTETGDFEGYGIAAIEAALCGCPAVVSADSGLAEAIRDGETGFCVEPEDPPATAQAITRLLEDDPMRRRMGESARRRAEEEQTWDGRIAAYDSLLRDVAGSGEGFVSASPATFRVK
jgi:phosphatidyl-myo-inositol dimannoside synthase